MSASSESKGLVLVTGGTGFIASHIIKVLIEKGYFVRATVRKLTDKHRYEALHEVCGDVERVKLQFVEADLESPAEAWDAAVKGCVACIHTAAPVKLTSKDPQKELINPTLKGIENVFGACQRSGTVKRVVYTSSITALSDSFEKWKSHIYTPEDWNTQSSLTRNAYSYAKTKSERAAHEFLAKNKGAFSLACVLPYTVLGPMLLPPAHLPETMDIPMRGALCGEMWGINYNFGISDVRDTALAHVAALEHLPIDGSAQEHIPRYILWSAVINYKDMVRVMGETIPERKRHLPKHTLPNNIVLLYVKATMERGVYQYVSANLRSAPKFDVSKVTNELGISLRPVEETVRDCCLYLKEAGLVAKKSAQHKKH